MCHITQQLRKHGSLLLRISMSGGLLAWVLSTLDLSTMWTHAKLLNPWAWAAALALTVAAQSLCSVRWWTLATALGIRAGVARFWRLYAEGLFFSLCLPSSIGGDVVKVFRVSPTKSGRVLAALSVATDRVMGLVVILIIGFTAMSGRALQVSGLATLGIGAALFAGVCGAMWLGMAMMRRFQATLAEEGRLAKILRPIVPYQDRPGVLIAAMGQSMVIQLMSATVLVALGWGLGLQVPLVAYYSIGPLVTLAMALPLSINGVGVREGLIVVLLREYGVAADLSAALGLLWFTVTVTTGLLGGLVYALAPKLTHEEDVSSEETTMPVEEKELRRAA